jgi:signal transduction histidine kinase
MTTVNTDGRRQTTEGLWRCDAQQEPSIKVRGARSGQRLDATENAEIVHDLKNALSVLGMFFEVMLLELPKSSALQGQVADIRLACHDADRLCEQILLSSTSSEPKSEWLDLSELVQRMAPLLETSLPRASGLHLEVADDLPQLELVPGAIRQIVINLVKNAAESLSDDSGVVTIRTGWIELDTHARHNVGGNRERRAVRHICLSISDTGCGMNEATCAGVLNGNVTTKSNGHGLGLASVRRIAAAHDSVIRLESRVGFGTTVQVVFGAAADVQPCVLE